MLNMLIKRKGGRTHTEDRHLALLLATTAGILNAMALGAFGFFPRICLEIPLNFLQKYRILI